MNKVLILDFGSQYTQLIARRVREQQIYSEIHPCTIPLDDILKFKPSAVILSGGPASVKARGAPKVDTRLFESGIPILGICYGMQLIADLLGGDVVPSKSREYGRATLILRQAQDGFQDVNGLFRDVPASSTVWMSHGDSILKVPPGFRVMATTENGTTAAIGHTERKIEALQFHPEVVHTEHGQKILRNFLLEIAGILPDWSMRSFIDHSISEIREKVGDHQVILGLSGGVDSSVAAVLVHRAIGQKLTCIFVDNGLLRKDEGKEVETLFRGKFGIRLDRVNAGKLFLKGLKGVEDPEKKRKIIGKIFIEVFEKEAARIKGASFLVQGTLYPDVIESVSFKGPSATITTHHNGGGLPKKMGLKLIEPFRELFKDEVRRVGRELGLPKEIVDRHPFPGPGLAVRILGEVTVKGLSLLREADAIVTEEFRKSGWYDRVWQAFAVLLPVKSVGVMGDERTYENVCALRVVTSQDGMTADWVDLPHELLGKISNRIINEVKGLNRVVYDISSKPPATIEWE